MINNRADELYKRAQEILEELGIETLEESKAAPGKSASQEDDDILKSFFEAYEKFADEDEEEMPEENDEEINEENDEENVNTGKTAFEPLSPEEFFDEIGYALFSYLDKKSASETFVPVTAFRKYAQEFVHSVGFSPSVAEALIRYYNKEED